VEGVRYGLLGPMEISAAGRPLKLPGRAECALLAQLLLSPGRTLPVTQLIDRLWSESTLPTDPMNALQLRVSKLRRALKGLGLHDVVTRDGAGYRADVQASAVDAVDFVARVTGIRASADVDHPRRLRAYDDALALWRGPALSDFATEPWAAVATARLSEVRLAAVTERSHAALALGRHLEVVSDLEPWVAEDPTLESLAALLMVALYRSGRQADALAVFARTRSVLDEELGLEPSLSLKSLQARVLRQDASLGEPAQDLPSPPAPSSTGRRRSEDRLAPTNLPTVVRPLIGRAVDLDAVSELIRTTRLLTLIGPGGAGKTSLALAAVARSAEAYDDGAFGIRLAAVTSPGEVPLAVADAIGVPLDSGQADRDVRDRLLAYLAHRRVLLLFDNCEHVIDAVAALVDDMLGRCPDVTVLATSQEALAIPAEVQVIVGPLEVPPEGAPTSETLAYPATQLFVERARAVRPGLVFTADELAAIGHIARALDGLPLALELAAARVVAMSATEISDRLDQRFGLLTSGARTAEARQRTLRATVEWSYTLMTDQEQRVFDRLSVFQGGWTLAAAEAVVGDESMAAGTVLEIIGRLVQRSMVVVERGERTRYRMLETLRQYASEKLTERGDAVGTRSRHAEYFRERVEEADVALRGRGQRDAFLALLEEQPNIRTALAWFGRRDGDPDAALTMAGALGLFWHLGRHVEGREVLNRLIEAPAGSPLARARAMQALSLVQRPRACLVHPDPVCADAAAQSLATFDEADEVHRAALSRVLLAVEGVTGAHRERSEALLREAFEVFSGSADAWGLAVIGFVRMEMLLKSGDVAGSLDVGHGTAAAFRRLDDPWGLSATLYHLGWGLRQFGRYDEAARVLAEAIDVADSAHMHNTVQWALADLAVTQMHLGHEDSARALLDRASATSTHVGDGAGELLADYGHGLLAWSAGEWEEARRRLTAAVEGFGRLATPVMEGQALTGLASCDEAAGDAPSAQRRFESALVIGRRTREAAVTAAALEGLSRLAYTSGDDASAARLAREASDLRAAAVRPAPPHERRHHEGMRGGADLLPS
jgi:predicted ATPase/DNA-binding SARP family transcriptional activator